MGQKLYSEDAGGIRFTSRRKGEVRIPNYVYDLWLPLLGATAIGVYSMYCRLEREDIVKAMTQARIAKMCRIGTRKLAEINDVLEDCGFIVITKPEGHKRLMHWTTEIEIFEAEERVSQKLIDKYAPESGYECLSPWLVAEKLPNISAEVTQHLDKKLGDNANVVSLGLNPLEVETAPIGAAAKKVEGPALVNLEKSPEPMTIEVVDEGYTNEKCPWCEVSIYLNDLSKTAAMCPKCKTPLYVKSPGGATTHKPPQEFRSTKKKAVIGDVIPNCPDKLADVMYYQRDRKTLELLLGLNRDMLLDCLNWAVGKMARGKLPPNSITSSAISWMQDRVNGGGLESQKQPAQKKEQVILPDGAVNMDFAIGS